MARLLFHIISGILGLYLALKFVPGVEFNGQTKTLIMVGVVFGIVNFLLKPILNVVTLPLKIITLGIFGLVVNMLLVWMVAGVFFPHEFAIHGIIALFWTTLIIWVLNFFFGLIDHKSK